MEISTCDICGLIIMTGLKEKKVLVHFLYVSFDCGTREKKENEEMAFKEAHEISFKRKYKVNLSDIKTVIRF